MDLIVRNLEEEDYKLLNEWWLFWWKAEVPRKMLPDNISDGIIVEYKGLPICASFLYATSSSTLYWLEFMISSNTFKDKKIRQEAINYNIKVQLELAKRGGALTIFSSIKHPSLINSYLKNGFVYGDKNMTNMIFNIKKACL